MPLDIPDILSRCRLLAKVNPVSLAALTAMARLHHYAPGEVIFRQDTPCPGLFIVGRGVVRVYKTAPTGKEHVLHMVEPGGTFAEAAAIGGFDLPANAQAVAQSTCVLLPEGPLTRMLDSDPRLARELLSGMAHWVKHLVGLLEGVVLHDAVGRVARYLSEHADERGHVSVPGRKRDLASHLNLTSETLSRALRRLGEADLIEQGNGQRLRVVDRAALAEAAGGVEL